MIAVDTNVLVRLFVSDDPEQAALARGLLEDAMDEGSTCFVSAPVLCELEWVLASSYRASRAEVLAAIERLVEEPLFEFENRKAVLQALAACRQGRAQFADHLIGASAQALGAETTWTFDRALRNCAGFSLLE